MSSFCNYNSFLFAGVVWLIKANRVGSKFLWLTTGEIRTSPAFCGADRIRKNGPMYNTALPFRQSSWKVRFIPVQSVKYSLLFTRGAIMHRYHKHRYAVIYSILYRNAQTYCRTLFRAFIRSFWRTELLTQELVDNNVCRRALQRTCLPGTDALPGH